MPTPTAIDLANKYRAQLAAQEADAAERMGRIYSRIYSSMIGEINDLADDIYALGPKAKKEQILKLARLQRILNQVRDEAGKFGVTVRGEVDNIRLQAIQAGVDNAIALIDASLPPLTPEMRKQVLTSLTRLPTDAVESAAGILGPDSPLIAKLQDDFGIAVADQVEMHIVDGIAFGMNPRTIAAMLSRNLQADIGTGLGWVLTTVRTAQIKAYQTANHATYLANSRIVPEWVWVSALDDRTCMSCVAMHGTVHPVTETLNDHHNGRCLISGEMVKTKRGNVKIEDVVIGDMVLTHTGSYQMVMATSKRDYSGVVHNINGLTTTPEHPFLTQRGWVEAKDLTASDTLFTLKSIDGLVSTRKTTQPSDFKKSSFFLSCGRFFAELCQRGSSSTANFISGKAKSILKLPTANCGTGFNPFFISASKNSASFSDATISQLFCLYKAVERARFFIADLVCNVWLRNSGLRSIWRAIAAFGVIGSISNFFIKRITDRVLIPVSAVSSLYDAPSPYLRTNQSRTGSPSLNSNSLSHCSDCSLPLSEGDFFIPNALARCNTAFRVLLGNSSEIAKEFISQKFSKITLSSSVVHFISSLLCYGTIIQQPIKKHNRLLYSGAVYNLQVDIDESFIANGIVVHNCAPLPKTISYKDLGINLPDPVGTFPQGEKWFNAQPASTQMKMMGNGKYEAYKAGKFKFADLSSPYKDEVYGELLRAATLKELLKRV